MTAFRTPATSFSALDAGEAALLLSSAADITLVLDTEGTVRDLAVPNEELCVKLGARENWIGRAWAQLLNQASRGKAALMLADAASGKPPKWHHLNHVGAEGGDVPVLYAAAPMKAAKRLILFGRDLRPLSLLQQRLIDSQHTMERDHGRMRQLELRYRLILQTSHDPLLVVNAANLRVVEANPAMAGLLGRAVAEMPGLPALDLFAANDRTQIESALSLVRASGHADPMTVGLQDATRVSLSALVFREDTGSLLLLRLIPTAPLAAGDPETQPMLLKLVEQSPDAFIITDTAGRVLSANAAFLGMADIARPRDVVGQPLDKWLGRAGVDLDVLLNNLRERGTVRLFATALTAASGLSIAVEVSAVALTGGPDGGKDSGAFGFAVRDIERRVTETRQGREQPRSVDQLTELIGRVALKDLVREATDMIERLAIEAALEKTNDNRASAAELLGLSRQSLYVKLHRYGLGDLAEAPS